MLNSVPANQIAAPSDAKSKVPDQSGPLPTHSLHVDLLCSSHLCGEGLSWAAFRGRDYYVCLRTGIHDGQVRSSPRQVHGVLHDVSRSLFWSWFLKCFWLIYAVVSNSKRSSDISQSFLLIFFWVYPFKTNRCNWPCKPQLRLGCLNSGWVSLYLFDSWPSSVHKILINTIRRCCAKGCERCCGHHQD